ncbi:MAG: hypothetical protein ACRD8K_08750 [Nitrososphaeraceae archaeon]
MVVIVIGDVIILPAEPENKIFYAKLSSANKLISSSMISFSI